MTGKFTLQGAWGGGAKPKLTFLFLHILTLIFLQKKDINKTFNKQQRFWKLDKNWQSYCPLNIGASVIIGALVMHINSAVECPRSSLLTGLESLGIAK